MSSIWYMSIYIYGKAIIGLVLCGLVIYTLILVIKALKIYIKNNSNI